MPTILVISHMFYFLINLLSFSRRWRIAFSPFPLKPTRQMRRRTKPSTDFAAITENLQGGNKFSTGSNDSYTTGALDKENMKIALKRQARMQMGVQGVATPSSNRRGLIILYNFIRKEKISML